MHIYTKSKSESKVPSINVKKASTVSVNALCWKRHVIDGVENGIEKSKNVMRKHFSVFGLAENAQKTVNRYIFIGNVCKKFVRVLNCGLMLLEFFDQFFCLEF
jgi:hypothetical protein